MENITMTNAMTQISRVRGVCPQVASRSLITAVRGAFQGTGVSAFGLGVLGAFGVDDFALAAPAPAFYVPTHKLSSMDVAYLRSGRPPV